MCLQFSVSQSRKVCREMLQKMGVVKAKQALYEDLYDRSDIKKEMYI